MTVALLEEIASYMKIIYCWNEHIKAQEDPAVRAWLYERLEPSSHAFHHLIAIGDLKVASAVMQRKDNPWPHFSRVYYTALTAGRMDVIEWLLSIKYPNL